MTNSRILECVPNISEGRDISKIFQITAEIEKVEGVKLLHIDQGYDANRTVITFAGNPEAVVEAAFQSVKKASEIIDMRLHKGVHPRFGAIDVLPFIPISGISMEETITQAHKLGQRIGEELGIHIYFYEYAAMSTNRRNLANCRAGEYEGLSEKINQPEWKPDYGPVIFNAQSGAIALSARNFLLAYNVNLNTNDVQIAKAIAGQLRESGTTSKKIENGKEIIKHVPGKMKDVKAIGWYIPEIGRAQVSTNIINIHTAPLHIVFETVKIIAQQYNIEVTGSELIGLIPMKVLLAAGEYYSPNHANTTKQKMEQAVKRLGLNDISIFEINKRVLEYCSIK